MEEEQSFHATQALPTAWGFIFFNSSISVILRNGSEGLYANLFTSAFLHGFAYRSVCARRRLLDFKAAFYSRLPDTADPGLSLFSPRPCPAFADRGVEERWPFASGIAPSATLAKVLFLVGLVSPLR